MIRWPWVSRELYEGVCQARDGFRAAFDRLQTKHEETIAEMLRMKREGFEPQPPPPAPPKDLLTAEIRQAIAQRSEPRSRERQHLESVALGLLEAGIGETDVAQQILEGEEPE